MKYQFIEAYCEFCQDEHPEWDEQYEHLLIAVKDGKAQPDEIQVFVDSRRRQCVLLGSTGDGLFICREHFNAIDMAWVQVRASSQGILDN